MSLNSFNRPGRTLHSRVETLRYMELYTNAKGETKTRVRTVTTRRQYRGSFEHDGTGWIYHTPCGFLSLKDNDYHFYMR